MQKNMNYRDTFKTINHTNIQIFNCWSIVFSSQIFWRFISIRIEEIIWNIILIDIDNGYNLSENESLNSINFCFRWPSFFNNTFYSWRNMAIDIVQSIIRAHACQSSSARKCQDIKKFCCIKKNKDCILFVVKPKKHVKSLDIVLSKK